MMSWSNLKRSAKNTALLSSLPVRKRKRAMVFAARPAKSPICPPAKSGGNPIDFAGGQIGDFAGRAAKTMALLRFLTGKLESKAVFLAERFKFDHDIIAAGQRLAKTFGLNGNIIVIPGEAAAKNGLVAAVHGCAAETHHFGQSR